MIPRREKLWRESCAICGADVVLSPHYGHADRRRHPVDGRIRCFDHLGVDLPDHP